MTQFHSDQHAAIVRRLSEAFSKAGHELFLVGGYNRSMALGHEPHDLDFATDAPPRKARSILKTVADRRDNGMPSVHGMGLAFGTVGGTVLGEKVEVTTFREDEEYGQEHRRPVALAFGSSFKSDAARRDFTMNSLGYDCLRDRMEDHFGGLEDISLGVIRTVGDPARRFAEDPLRILRAARFAAELGFSVEEGTLAGMRSEAAGLGRVAPQRVGQELLKLLTGPRPAAGLEVLAETGALAVILPEIDRMRDMRQPELHHDKDVFRHTLAVVEAVPPQPVLRLAALLHDVGKPDTFSVTPSGTVHFYGHESVGEELARQVLQRLRFPKDTVTRVAHMVRRHMYPHRLTKMWGLHGRPHSDIGDRELRRFLAKLELVRTDGVVLVPAEDVLLLNRGDILGGRPGSVAASLGAWEETCRLVARARLVPEPARPTQSAFPAGYVVAALGLDPRRDGLLIRDVLAAVRMAIEAGQVEPDDREAVIALAREALLRLQPLEAGHGSAVESADDVTERR